MALAAVAVSVKPRGKVSVKVRDPSLQIFEARYIPWQTNHLQHLYYRQTWLDLLETYSRPVLARIGIHTFPHAPSSVQWEDDPQYYGWNMDVLVLFGYRRGGVRQFGLDLVDSRGEPSEGRIGQEGVSFGIPPHRYFLTNEFAVAHWIPLGARGSFALRFHGETNVLADVVIR